MLAAGHLHPRANYRTMISGGRNSTTGGPMMTAGGPSYLACRCRPPSATMQPVVESRVMTQVNSRIVFMFVILLSG